ncbi:S9 family peptidase [Sphingomonas sp. Leaf25]|uniref:S9 family peptidase n=1 Tax=Sphingomonas sp. Leaf25 TaxID=1735692 RepID=UPI0006F21682|nr:S9 family peptidase [Sphingomonas sp. Leaf25]KQN07627.1 peptidase S9 [Sphingomonas sp. Leaf25]
MRALLALALLAAPVAAQDVPARIDASIALRDRWQWLTRDIAEPAQWDADGRHFHYRKTVEGGFAFVDVDAATLAKTPAFDAAAIAAALTKAGGVPVDPLRLPFDRFAYVDGRKAIELPVGEVRIRCTLIQPVCARLPEPVPQRDRGFGVVRDLRQPADNTPRRSPDGSLEALVVDNNLVVRAAGGGAEKWRAQDGSPGDFHDPETIAWSPDSRHVAVYRVRPGYSRMVTRIVAAPPGRVQPEVVQQLYPKPGDTVDREQPVLFDVATGRHTDIADTLFPNAYTLSAPYWRPDGRTLAFDYIRRGFGAAKRIAVDAASGQAHVSASDEATTFVFRDRIFTHDLGRDGAELIQTSERDGWRHLYLVDGRTGRVKRQITRGKWLVRDIAKVDEGKRQIWFSASGYVPGEDPYYKHWFRIGFDGRNLTRLTTADATHEVRFAPDMGRYVDTYSRSDLPETSELHGPDGRLVAVLERGDVARLTAAGYRPPERFVAKGRDGVTDIHGLVVRPQDYDPARRYPVIENIYAGPHDSFVPKGFWPFGPYSGGDKVIGMQAQADLGFIVVMIDGMGTANRSKAFHDVAWKNLADSGFPDRIAWLRALAAKDAGVDLTRVGIYGGSAGGQSTLNALLFHGDVYKAGVAYAGCFDNRMDKIDWNEQWLGWPVDASYLAGSGVVHAARLKGDLLLVVGEQDSNVDPASTTQVVDALVRAGKRFDLLVVPNGEHGAGRSTGPVPYAMRRQYDFFLRTLRGEGVGDWNTR